MAIKVRCEDCNKKVSIDQAFAGGVCRCPYCTAIVFVPDADGQRAGGERPESPRARPETPTAAAPAEEITIDVDEAALAEAHGQTYIPTASPVKLQGIVSIVLSVLLLVMIGVLVGIIVIYAMEDDGPPTVGPEVGAFTVNTDKPAVAGTLPVTTPVVYCIDTSGNMGDVIEYAGDIVLASLKSLKDGKFAIILCGEQADKATPAMPASDEDCRKAAAALLADINVLGAADLGRSLRTALQRSPRTIVLMARDIDMGTPAAVEEIKQAGVRLVTVGMGSSEDSAKELAELAKSTGGKSRTFAASDLEMWAEQAKDANGKKDKKGG